jgi:3-methylcrotonyl-CoA carboxylase alpha subunit
VRVDAGVERGGEVSLHYDPMIAKLISRGATRDEAIDGLIDALDTPLVVHPVKTNAGFLRRCLDHADFRSGSVDTRFIDARLETLAPTKPPALFYALSALAFADGGPAVASAGADDPWAVCDGFRINSDPVIETGLDSDGARLAVLLSVKGRRVFADIDGVCLQFELKAYDPSGRLTVISDHQSVHAAFERRGRAVLISAQGETHLIERFNPAAAAEALEGGGAVKAPMPGKLLSVPVAAGDAVAKGQTLAVLEAMKMEHALAAPRDGVVEAVNVSAGAQVGDGDVLVTLAED